MSIQTSFRPNKTTRTIQNQINTLKNKTLMYKYYGYQATLISPEMKEWIVLQKRPLR